MIGAQYGQAGAMFILLTSDAVLKSSALTKGFLFMYSKSCAVFFSRISIVHGRFSESAVVGCWLLVVGSAKGHRKLFRPFMTAMLRGFLFCFRMNLSLV